MKLDITPITNVLLTKSDTDRFMRIMSEISDTVYSLKSPLSEKIDTLVPYSFKSAIEVFFEKNKIDIKKKQVLQEALTALQIQIKSIPIMTIRIAYEPTGKQIKALVAQLGVLTDVQIIVNPVFDPAVIGGAIIEYQGKIGDYSLENHIHEKL